MIYVQVDNAIGAAEDVMQVDRSSLKQAAYQTLQRADLVGDMTIVLTDDARLHELNNRFLGIDATTDVLAFPSGDTDPDSQAVYLGDVLISYPRALSQAVAGGHSIEAELQLLVVHGVLHLLGYDHVDEKGQAAMWAVQSEVLTRLECPITLPPSL